MWQTLQFERTVVGAARTITSATRLLDVLEVLRPDPRIRIVFGLDRRSVFSDGVADLLKDAGATTVPWEEVAAFDCDLVVSASENVDGAPGGVPVLVVPHGVGFHKLIPTGLADGPRVSGLVPDSVLDGRTMVLAVSHEAQIAQIEAANPRVARRAVVTGDLAVDQLVAGERLRSRYRRALHCSDGRRLVVLSSTWGPASQFGTWSRLAAELAGALPVDDFRIAQILHPNIWASLGGYQIRSLLHDALDAGVALIAPHRGWQAALVAADLVVGDHGSVTFYAAALGRPVLLAAFGEDEIVGGTAMSALGAAVPRLHRDRRLHAQITAALADPGPGSRYSLITDGALHPPGSAAERIRTTLYDLLSLTAPTAPTSVRAAPDPLAEVRGVRSFSVYSTVTGSEDGPTVTLLRYPAAADGVEAAGNDERDTVRHLLATADEPDQRIAQSATVVFDGQSVALSAAAEVTADILAMYPWCTMAAVAAWTHCAVRIRGADSLVLLTVRGEYSRSNVIADRSSRDQHRSIRPAADLTMKRDGPALASTAYALLRAGMLGTSDTVLLRLGDHEFEVGVTTYR